MVKQGDEDGASFDYWTGRIGIELRKLTDTKVLLYRSARRRSHDIIRMIQHALLYESIKHDVSEPFFTVPP